MSVLDGLRLSLPDIAELAHVQRPVVSTWRRRHATGSRPFPEPVALHDGAPRFQASAVVGWVEATGLGNNAAFGADVALRAVLDDAESALPDDVRLDGIAGLLAIKAYATAPLTGLTRGDVLDLADELDPEDAFLYSEVAALDGELARACELADLAASAAYTPGAALEALLADRFRARRAHLAASALHPAALDLIARVVRALAPRTVIDPSPGAGDLLHAVLALPGVVDPPVAELRTGAASRVARRRLAAHGWEADDERPDDPTPDRVILTAAPTAGEPELDDLEVLRRVDDVVLGLHRGQRAVVIGPASALADAAAAPPVEAARGALLRTDRLRTVAVLPPGLVSERPRQRLAMWVLGDAHPAVAIADRWTMVADLTSHPATRGQTFPRAVVEDLLTDVVASLGEPRDVARHAFRFARFVGMPELLARGGSLTEAGRRALRGAYDDAGATAVRVRELATVVAHPAPRVLGGIVVESGAAHPVPRLSLSALLDRGLLRRRSGNRVAPSDVIAAPVGAGATRVVGVPELVGESEWGSRTVDTLTFVGTAAAARLTEPGDVVFCTAPRPAARVDTDGFSVVQFPAQVLRAGAADGAGPALVPEILAADISAQPPTAKRWRAWEVRLVPPGQADVVGRALREVRDAADSARRRIADLEALAAALADGVTASVVRLRQDEPAPPVVEPVETTPTRKDA